MPTTGERYTIVQGDTLFGISRKLNVGLPDLLSANGLNESSLIVPGQQLDVPAGRFRAGDHAGTATAADRGSGCHRSAAGDDRGTTPVTHGHRHQHLRPPAQQPTTTFAAPAEPIDAARDRRRRARRRTRPEADGTPIVFAPGNVLDHNPATAWRCEAGRPTSR